MVINAIYDSSGELIGFAKVTRDLTERRAAEEQLRQVQKMESVGQLTGGVAHDFNNLLTVIIGNLDALQRHLREPAPDIERLKRSADNAMRGARRGESLTQRLLAFSRQQPLEPRPVDIGRLVAGMSDLLRRTLGEQIAIETALSGGLWQVEVDPEPARGRHPESCRQCARRNARRRQVDAGNGERVPRPGLRCRPIRGRARPVRPASVSDSGVGMTPEVQARAFDPFFTTKDVGQGTGLGLSQVYGFVKQSRGHVKIYSEAGEGTTIKIYLPRLHAEQEIESTVDVAAPVRGRASETILVVEDDEDVRASTTEMLRDLGYTILEAANARNGLKLIENHPEIRLLFTDVGLPGGMNGRQLADEARRRHRNLKVLFASGYARNAIVHDGRLDPGVELITKPFTQDILAARVRDILDAGSTLGRVLVVEDEFMIQMLAVQYLEEGGLKADVAGSATDALNKLRLIPGGVDAVVIDLGLPDRPGDVLVREIRSLFPAMPVVLASGAHQAELQKLAKEQPHIAIVGKPYTAQTLIAALRILGIHC